MRLEPRRKKPTNVAGYRKAVLELAQQAQPKTVVEVGVYQGGLSRMLVTLASLESLLLVDSWLPTYASWNKREQRTLQFGAAHMEQVAENVIAWAASEPKITVWRMDSIAAAALVPEGSIDFWQTDGDHSLAGITADIEAWHPKVRVGGILCGDNYELPSVAAGVDRLLPQRQLAAKGRLWWLVKSG